jgi:hypothetical protein
VKKCRLTVLPRFVGLLIEITSRQQQTQRTLLDWLRVEYAIEKPSNKLLAAAELDSDTWVGAGLVEGDLVAEVKLVLAQRFRGGFRHRGE